jgi:hypothetical protein
MDFKQKYLKYKMKYLELKNQIGGGIDPMQILHAIKKPARLTELPDDIEVISDVQHRCRICKALSGSLLVIPHSYNCMYNNSTNLKQFIFGERTPNKSPIDPSKCLPVLQRQSGCISNITKYTTIGTYGLGPCICICMRARDGTLTALSHIDGLTEDILGPYYMFPPDATDVYIIGGDSTSRDLINNILELLDRNNYKITFAHILDSKDNSFAINCITGETYLNDEIIPIRAMRLTKKHSEYLELLSFKVLRGIKSPLEEIKIE